MMHELLHIRRFDHLVHVLALSARALHWFNPLTWAATKRLIVERERACDDGVLAMGVASTSYADHLLGMARYVLTGKEASAGALAMARPSELRSRIVAILNPGQPRRALTGLRASGMAGCALAFVVLLSAMRPVEVSRTAPIELFLESEGDTAAAESTSLQAPAETAVAGALESTVETTAENEQLADTVDVEAQRRAIHAISELPEERGIPLLRDIAESHPNTELREEAIFWLGQVGDGSTADLLASFARNDVSEEVQKKAIFALSELEDELGVPHLRDLAKSNLPDEIREEVVFWLGQVGGASVADELEAFARNDESREVQKKAIFALSEIDDASGTQRLINLAKSHPNSDMQAEAVFWLGQRGGGEIADILADFARNGASQEIQKKAVFALSEIDGDEGVPHLINLARTHPNADVRSEAIFWLGETGDPRAADVLMEIVNGK
jgi:HEAT repeat protein